MRQRLWWQVPLLLLSLLLAGGALRADTVAGLDFASSDWSASDPLASTIAAPGVPAELGAARTRNLTPGQPNLEPGRGLAPGWLAIDGVSEERPYQRLLRAWPALSSNVAARSVGVAQPRLGRAPPRVI